MQLFGAGGGAPKTGDDDLVFDVTDADFMEKVIDASRARPVIVDFWAPWCGPCKTLGPAIEAAVRDAKGKVALAKIDIDQNQMVASQLRVQSIPAVFAFVNGQPVDGFMGALPASQLKQFIDQVIQAAGDGAEGAEGGPSVDDLLAGADQALSDNAIAEAGQLYAAAMQLDPTELRAIAGMARVYAAAGDIERAKQALQMAPADKASDPAIAGARSAVELAEQSAEAAGKLAVHRAALEANPNNHQARLDLALALVATGDKEGAVGELLDIFRRDRTWNEEAAKTQLLKLFEAFGANDPITQDGRRRLSSLMFS